MDAVDTFPRLFELAKAAEPNHKGGTPFDQNMRWDLVKAIFESHDINIGTMVQVEEAMRDLSLSKVQHRT